MKKKNLSSLVLRKKRISNLYLLSNYSGNIGNGETTTVGTDTILNFETLVSCPETEVCNTENGGSCQTTRTLADNTFDNTCSCNAFNTGVTC